MTSISLKVNKNLFKSSFAINSLWAIMSLFVSKGLNFITIAYVAKTIGPKQFGEFNVIQTTVGLFGTVSGLGLGLAATKLIAEFRDVDQKKVGEIIGSLFLLSNIISVIVFVIFFISSTWIAESLLGNPNLSILLKITSFIVVLDAMIGVQNGILSGLESFRDITFVNAIVGLVSSPLMIIGTLYLGLTGLVIMLLASRAINVWINSFYLNKNYRNFKIAVKTFLKKDKLKPIFGISIPSFLSSMATSPVNWISTTIFVNQPMGFSALGIYNAANQLRQFVLFLPDSAGKVSIPAMANAFGNGDFIKFRSTVLTTFLWNLVLSLGPAIVIFFFSGIFKNFIGKEYVISTNLILIILATGILVALNNAIGYIFICSNLIWYDLLLRIFWGITLIVLLLLYGRYNGVIGYAISILGATVVHMFIQISLLIIGVGKQLLKREIK